MKRDINDVGGMSGPSIDASMASSTIGGAPTGMEDVKRQRPMDPCRSLYIGGIDNSIRPYDLCKVASSFGPLESAKIIYEKKCAFVNFVSLESATAMHAAANTPSNAHEDKPNGGSGSLPPVGGLQIGNRSVSVGWGKAKPFDEIYLAQIEAGASRCIFVTRIKVNGGIVESCLTEEELAMTFASFGEVESVVVIAQKGIAFVNFMSIRSAMKAIKAGEEDGIRAAGGRTSSKLVVKFAVDTGKKSSQNVYCPDPRNPPGSIHSAHVGRFQGGQAHFHPGGGPAGFPLSHRPQYPAPPPPPSYPTDPYGRPSSVPAGSQFGQRASPHQGSRSLYLSKVPEQTSYRDLCSIANMYGRLDSVRLNREKKNAFFNFIDPAAANNLYQYASAQGGIGMHGETMRVGWAKSQVMRPEVAEQIKNDGLSRTLFLSGVPENANEDHLRDLFDPFSKGEYESVTVLPAKHIAFVNFTQMSVARAAKMHFDTNPEEAKILGIPFQVKYGREKIHEDRNPPGPGSSQPTSFDTSVPPPNPYRTPQYAHPVQDPYAQHPPADTFGQRAIDSYGQHRPATMGTNAYPHTNPHPPSYPNAGASNPYESASQLGFPTFSTGSVQPSTSSNTAQPQPGTGKFWITDGSGNYTEIDAQQLAALNSLNTGVRGTNHPIQPHQQVKMEQTPQQQYMDY